MESCGQSVLFHLHLWENYGNMKTKKNHKSKHTILTAALTVLLFQMNTSKDKKHPECAYISAMPSLRGVEQSSQGRSKFKKKLPPEVIGNSPKIISCSSHNVRPTVKIARDFVHRFSVMLHVARRHTHISKYSCVHTANRHADRQTNGSDLILFPVGGGNNRVIKVQKICILWWKAHINYFTHICVSESGQHWFR